MGVGAAPNTTESWLDDIRVQSHSVCQVRIVQMWVWGAAPNITEPWLDVSEFSYRAQVRLGQCKMRFEDAALNKTETWINETRVQSGEANLMLASCVGEAETN